MATAAQHRQLPCDGDDICMLCSKKPADDDKLICNTCATPWHLSCLSVRPETLASALQWECPDCAPVAAGDVVPAPPPIAGGVSSGVSSASGELIAEIRAIEADKSLTDQEKARKRQELMSRGCRSPDLDESKSKKNRKNGVLGLIDESLNCSFCMQLLERPVTTPCGHNFCLKCFQKWVGQGKRTCVKCRRTIPDKIASQPRINAALVVAIRMAKVSNLTEQKAPPKVYHFMHNQNRPDTAFVTERAKKTGKANACSGKIFVTVPPDHFGPILAENDPVRNQGVLVGESWEDRMECRQWGTHLPHVAGIAGQSDYGAQSVALSGGYEDDEDHGEWFLYTGSGGRDLSGNKRTNKEQSFDQEFNKMNESLRVSCKKGYPVRVVRSHKEKRSSYAPETGVRYDGVYRIEKCWRKVGIQGKKVCRYLFVRCDNEPAPWTSDEHGDRPRSLPSIPELKKATDVTERKESPHWDYNEEEDRWKWKKPQPSSRKKQVPAGSPGEMKMIRVAIRQAKRTTATEKLLKEFSCLICRNVMTLPLTTPCAHNFCKPCLENAFSGQTFVRERTCQGRTLRAQKNIMKCPSCSNDISDFLQNPQVNRDVMDVIERLKSEAEAAKNAEESSDEESIVVEKSSAESIDEETNGTEKPVAEELHDDETNVIEESSDAVEGVQGKLKRTCKRKKTDGGDCSKVPDKVGNSNISVAEELNNDETNVIEESSGVVEGAQGKDVTERLKSEAEAAKYAEESSDEESIVVEKSSAESIDEETNGTEKPVAEELHDDETNVIEESSDAVEGVQGKLKRTCKRKKADGGDCSKVPDKVENSSISVAEELNDDETNVIEESSDVVEGVQGKLKRTCKRTKADGGDCSKVPDKVENDTISDGGDDFEIKPKRSYKQRKTDNAGDGMLKQNVRVTRGRKTREVKTDNAGDGMLKQNVRVTRGRKTREVKTDNAGDGMLKQNVRVTRGRKTIEVADEGNESPSSPLHVRSDGGDDFE